MKYIYKVEEDNYYLCDKCNTWHKFNQKPSYAISRIIFNCAVCSTCGNRTTFFNKETYPQLPSIEVEKEIRKVFGI
jgi:transcription initiation factor IIE alpha subunit